MDQLLELAKQAGDAIMEVYNSDDFGIEQKADDSPLTKADLASHQIIVEALERLTPEIPVLSEESAKIPFKTPPELEPLLADRPARRHPRVRQTQWRVHRQHRPGGKSAGDARRDLCAGAGALLLRRTWRGGVEKTGPGRGRGDSGASQAAQSSDRRRQPLPRRQFADQIPRKHRPSPADIHGQLAEVLPGGRGQRRSLPTPWPHLRVGHRRCAGGSGGCRRQNHHARYAAAALQHQRFAAQPLLLRVRRQQRRLVAIPRTRKGVIRVHSAYTWTKRSGQSGRNRTSRYTNYYYRRQAD
uniref:Sulfite synthesis pathway protein n=1 Tax=Candidatus Endoriftia persephone str. Hot96_1+Hot96_2 TaxID=394104 RepID=Q0PQT7_9GAMM|nr:sulfite synthesis pathway protein [Candidatus Endoriftia persephone str. Hot96_1+Hot96_2]